MPKPLRYYSNGRHNEEGGTNVKLTFEMTKSFIPQEGEYKEACCKLGKYI
jgi:hypothetical protein